APADQRQWLSPAKAWFIVFATFVAFVAGQMDRYVMSMLVTDMKRDLLFTDEQIGILLGFAFSLTYALSAIVGGSIGDRMSRRKVLMVGVAFWSFLTAICGLAKSFPAMFAARLGVGVGESVLAPCALPLVASAFPPERRSFPIAFAFQGSAVGHIITP